MIGAFRFRLLPVLRHRRLREEQRARALAQATQSVETAARQLTRLREQASDAAEALRALVMNGAPAEHVRLLGEVPAELSRRAAQVAAELEALRHRAQAALRELIRASQDRQALERLQERQRDAHHCRQTAEAHREHDEAAPVLQRWRRDTYLSEGANSP